MPETPYTFLLRMLRKRFPPVIAESPDLPNLSIAELLNLLFALFGSWGTVGEFDSTFRTLSKMVGGNEIMWQRPPENQASTMVQ